MADLLSDDDVMKPPAPALMTDEQVMMPPTPPPSNEGFFQRSLAGIKNLPRDAVDEFMDGLRATVHAPAELMGYGTPSWPINKLSAPADLEQKLLANGYSPDEAKTIKQHVDTSATQAQGVVDLYTGPAQMIFGPLVGAPFRSLFSRPLEESAGIPKEYTELGLGLGLLAAGGASKFAKMKWGSDGTTRVDPVGDVPPRDGDYGNTAKILTDPKNQIIDADYTVVEDNLRLAWQNDGMHPSEMAQSALNHPDVREQLRLPPPHPIDRSGIEPPTGGLCGD